MRLAALALITTLTIGCGGPEPEALPELPQYERSFYKPLARIDHKKQTHRLSNPLYGCFYHETHQQTGTSGANRLYLLEAYFPSPRLSSS